ncbi:hypothetical protein [Plantactinospora sp. CA-290183]|uniref:hypothetical protein n=1 Tax=Plantactinospora sp. CA-290183 TaxID=3240006 RepID=UPI003D90CEE2
MPWPRRKPHPVPYAPRHRRDWRRLWRYCRCGHRWRCPDSRVPPTSPPYLGGYTNQRWTGWRGRPGAPAVPLEER